MPKCCGAVAPVGDAAISQCVTAATAWNQEFDDDDSRKALNTCAAKGAKAISGEKAATAWLSGSGTTSTVCNTVKKDTCNTGLTCPKATLAPVAVRNTQPKRGRRHLL